jgi:AcrR family transcriptional regulator
VTDEKRLQEGQERIAAAALNLFLQNGYHNTSVREVAQKAGLSVGSVFNYFISKEEILFFLLSSGQVRAETGFQKQRAEFERLKQDGASPRDLFLRAYERYAALTDELRRNTVLAYQETKSLTLAERKRFLEGEERIQHFFEEIIAYGISQGAFPAGDIRLKAHCLLVLAQSWAVRHWALSSFTKLDEYLEPLKSIALGILESDSQHTPALVAAQDDEEFVLSPELTS